MHKLSTMQRLLRERTLGRYVAALEQGDLETLASIMQRAEHDAVLEEMIFELHETYQSEEQFLTLVQEEHEMDFKEGIHKSIPQEELDELQAAENAPIHKHRKQTRWVQVLAAILVICVLIGGFLVLHTTPHPAAIATLPKHPSLKHNLCVVPGASINTNGSSSSLSAVSALSANDVWAVGSSDFLPLVEHWDGYSWKVVPILSPHGNPTTPKSELGMHTEDTLSGVAAVMSNDVWAVGETVSNGISNALIEHWDGNQWSTAFVAQFPSGFSSIAALSADDIWAVGTMGTPSGLAPLIEHWDGHNWSLVPLPTMFQGGELTSIAAVAPGDLWVSAYQPKPKGGLGTSTMLHWDGQQWKPAPLPAMSLGSLLLGISALNAHDIWAVGTTPGTLLVEHWDGTSWSVASNAQSPEEFAGLTNVVAVAPNDVWAVGGNRQLIVEHWDGKSWNLLAQSTMTGGLSGVAAAGGHVWAVGNSQANAAPLIEASC